MKRRRLLSLLLLVVACATAAPVAYFNSRRLGTRGPSYQGKPVTFWSAAVRDWANRHSPEAGLPTQAEAKLRLIIWHDDMPPPTVLRDDPAALPVLLELRRDPDGDVRFEAVRVLGRLYPQFPDLVIALGDAIRDKERNIRLVATKSLARGWNEAEPVLRAALEDQDHRVRYTAATAIGEHGPRAQGLVPELHKAMEDPEGLVRVPAALAVWKVGGPNDEVMALLLRELRDEDYVVRFAAVTALGSIGPQAKGALPQITRLLKDETISVREAAERAIKKIDPEARTASANH